MSNIHEGLKLVFVVQKPDSARRPKELAESEARSHAAVIGHRKKKAAGQNRIVLRAGGRLQPRPSKAVDREQIDEVNQPERVPTQAPVHAPSAICLGFLAPNTQAVHEVFCVTPFWNDLWLRCLSNETFCSAFFARLQACRDGLSAGGHLFQPSTGVLLRERTAIQALQRAFDKPTEIDEQSLLAMMQLGLLEGELGANAYADTHMDAVSRVLQKKLQEKLNNGRIRPMLAAFILTRAMEMNFPKFTPPPIQTPRFHGPILKGEPAILHASHIVQQLPSGFATLAQSGKLSIEVLQVLERITKFNRNAPSSLPTYHDGNNISHSNSNATNLSSNFWSACPSLTLPIPLHEEPDIDNLLALGLWLYVALEFSNRPVPESMLLWISMSRSTRQDLSTRLMRCIVPREDDEEECLMWLFEIAVASWIGPNGVLLPQGRILLDLRTSRFAGESKGRCRFERFFEFSKRWRGMEV